MTQNSIKPGRLDIKFDWFTGVDTLIKSKKKHIKFICHIYFENIRKVAHFRKLYEESISKIPAYWINCSINTVFKLVSAD